MGNNEELAIQIKELKSTIETKGKPVSMTQHISSIVVVLAFVWTIITGYVDQSLEIVKHEMSRLVNVVERLQTDKTTSAAKDAEQDKRIEITMIELKRIKEDLKTQ